MGVPPPPPRCCGYFRSQLSLTTFFRGFPLDSWSLLSLDNLRLWCTIFPLLPQCLSSKESAYQCRECKFNPCFRKIPWERKWQPSPVFLPGKSHGYRSLVCYSPWYCKESDMTLPLNSNNNMSSHRLPPLPSSPDLKTEPRTDSVVQSMLLASTRIRLKLGLIWNYLLYCSFSFSILLFSLSYLKTHHHSITSKWIPSFNSDSREFFDLSLQSQLILTTTQPEVGINIPSGKTEAQGK